MADSGYGIKIEDQVFPFSVWIVDPKNPGNEILVDAFKTKAKAFEAALTIFISRIDPFEELHDHFATVTDEDAKVLLKLSK